MSLEHGTTTNTCGSDHSATILLPTTAATGASVVAVARMDLIASIIIMLYSEEGSLSYR